MIYLLRKNIKTKRLSTKLDYTKLRLFKIKKILELVIFELDLSKTIRIYSIFYKSLLEPYYNLNIMLELIEINEETIELR